MQLEEGVKLVEIFTDGACKGNPGIGGWGVCLKFDGEVREFFGGEPVTTITGWSCWLPFVLAGAGITARYRAIFASSTAYRFAICAEGYQ